MYLREAKGSTCVPMAEVQNWYFGYSKRPLVKFAVQISNLAVYGIEVDLLYLILPTLYIRVPFVHEHCIAWNVGFGLSQPSCLSLFGIASIQNSIISLYTSPIAIGCMGGDLRRFRSTACSARVGFRCFVYAHSACAYFLVWIHSMGCQQQKAAYYS